MKTIHYCQGDIFEAKTQVIVNTVNCKGIMGKGLALAFKQNYPDMFVAYQQDCKTGKLRIGRPTLYRNSTPWILKFPTKDNWKANSKIEYLEQGLEYFAANYKEAGITSIAFPKLGTQNGKLSWGKVGPLMVKYLSKLDIEVYIYIAEGDKEYTSDNEAEPTAWKQFNELALSVEGLQHDVQLSVREAKKVVEKRQELEFTSLSDIHAIEGLARVSLKRIKEYIQHLQYPANTLPGMTHEEKSSMPKARNRARSSKSKGETTKDKIEPDASPLFSLDKIVV